MGIGRTANAARSTGHPLRLSFDGHPEWKAGGITIAWSTVAAVGSDTTLKDGYVVKSGEKYIRYGQPLLQITTSQSIAVSVTGTPTGGSFIYNLYDPRTGNVGTVTVPYDSSAAAHQTLLEAFLGSGNVAVAGGGALPGNHHIITTAGSLAGAILPLPTLASNGLTGGSSPTAKFFVKNQTITVTGTPTGGTAVLTFYNAAGTGTDVTLNFDDTVAEVQTALEAVYGAGNVLVTGAGALPGNVHTVWLGGSYATQVINKAVLKTNSLTGGSSPTVTMAQDSGAESGKYGPFDPNATDGRQTLAFNKVFLPDETILQYPKSMLGTASSQTLQVGVIEGGRVWKDRVLGNTSSATLAAGPLLADLQAKMPRLVLVEA